MQEAKPLAPQTAEDIVRIIDMQISRDIDLWRARDYWARTLASTPPEVLIDALGQALSHGQYQRTPRCCCRG
jgi:hypothetical protein